MDYTEFGNFAKIAFAIFNEFVKAGFTESQALQIVAMMIKNAQPGDAL